MQTFDTGAKPGLTRRIRANLILWCTVIIPTALALIYYGLIASDVYISESRFVVRSPQRQVQTGLSSLLQGTGFSRSQDDTYSVHDFVLSRDALKELDDQLAVRKSLCLRDRRAVVSLPTIPATGPMRSRWRESS